MRCMSALIVLVLLQASLISVQSQTRLEPDINVFFPKTKYGDLALSPSGKFLAFPDYRQYENEIVIVDLKLKKEIKRIKIRSRELNWVKWATEERLLAGVSYMVSGYLKGERKKRGADGNLYWVQEVKIHRVMALNKDGLERIFLFDKADEDMQNFVGLSKIEDILPNDPDHILMPAYDKGYGLWKVNIQSGELEKIEAGTANTYDWKVDHKGNAVVRYDSLKNGKIVKIYVRAPGQQKWQVIAKIRSEDLDIFNPIGPTKDPSIYYVSGRPVGFDKVGIFRYDLQNSKFLDQISSHDRVDLHTALIDDGGRYYGSVYYNDRYTYDFLDDDLNEHMKGLDVFFGNEYNILVKDVSLNGLIWILYVSGPRDPGSYYSYNTETHKADFLLSDNYDLEEQDLNKVEVIQYSSRDGVDLSGYLTVPTYPHSLPAPLIVMPHGGPQVRDYYIYNRMVQYLASLGYQVFQPNFRGSRGFGQKFEEAGYKEWGGKMQDDVTDGVKYLIESGKVSEDRICIMGLSYGGFSALSGVVKTPDMYQCAISINGVTDLREMIKYDLKRFKDSEGLEKFVKGTIGDLRHDSALIKERSPIHNTNKIKAPVLLIHGSEDDVVPVKQSRSFQSIMEKAKKSSKYIELADTDHNLMNVHNENSQSDDFYDAYKDALLAVSDFLNEHLSP